MHTTHGRDGPGANGGGRGSPEQITSTPDQTPSESRLAFSYGRPKGLTEQDAFLATGDGGPTPSQTPVWDSGWETERGFHVRTQFLVGPDGGLRRRLLEQLVLRPAVVPPVVDEDGGSQDDGDDADGLAGVRQPVRGPTSPGAAAAECCVQDDGRVSSLCSGR